MVPSMEIGDCCTPDFCLDVHVNNHHQNARITLYSPVLVAKMVREQGMYPWQVADWLGVSVNTVHEWVRRSAQGGLGALHDRSSRPHRSPRWLSVERVTTITALRRMRLSSLEITFALSLPVSSVTNEIRQLGLNKLSRLEPRLPVLRYEHEPPGDMVHIDIKKPGRIDGAGHCLTGDRSKRKRGGGWEYLRACAGDHNRLAYTELLSDEKATTAAGFLSWAVAWLARHGVQKRRVMTDNGSSNFPTCSEMYRLFWCTPGADQALHPVHQRQSRTRSPNQHQGMDLQANLRLIGRTGRLPPSLVHDDTHRRRPPP